MAFRGGGRIDIIPVGVALRWHADAVTARVTIDSEGTFDAVERDSDLQIVCTRSGTFSADAGPHIPHARNFRFTTTRIGGRPVGATAVTGVWQYWDCGDSDVPMNRFLALTVKDGRDPMAVNGYQSCTNPPPPDP
jgi:hypothetical protein